MKKKIIQIAGTIVVLVLFVTTYRLFCSIGLVEVHSENGISIYMPDTTHSEEASKLSNYLRSQIQEVDKKFEPNVSIYFCESLTEFHIKALSINTPLAVNRTPLKTIFVRPCDLSTMKIAPRESVLSERNIREVMLHEVMHCYEWETLGVLDFYRIKFTAKWKFEGFCDYVAGSSTFPIDKGLQIFLSKDCYGFVTENHIESEYFYFVSRLRTDYLLRYKQITQDDYWSTSYDEEQLDSEIRKALSDSIYMFPNL